MRRPAAQPMKAKARSAGQRQAKASHVGRRAVGARLDGGGGGDTRWSPGVEARQVGESEMETAQGQAKHARQTGSGRGRRSVALTRVVQSFATVRLRGQAGGWRLADRGNVINQAPQHTRQVLASGATAHY